MDFSRKCCDGDHICAIDYYYEVFVPLSNMDCFIRLRYISIRTYRRITGQPEISKTEMVEKWFADGKLFSHCPWCGDEIDYTEILKDLK